MSKIKKEHINGDFYEAYSYTHCMIPSMTPRQRSERQKVTEPFKQTINALQSRLRFMRLICLNFRSGQDIMLTLDYDGDEPDRPHAIKMVSKFYRQMKKVYRAFEREFKYIAVTERHGKTGEPVRIHHHIIINTLGRGERGERRDFDAIRECWPFGSFQLQTLYDSDNNFEDTAEYFLKSRREKGQRVWSCSRNLLQPDKPYRTFVPDSAQLEAPPGVKIIRQKSDGNQYGSYAYLIGQIKDHKAFEKYQNKLHRRKNGLRC